MLIGKPSKFGRIRGDAGDVAAYQFEHRSMHGGIGLRSGMGHAGDPRPRALDKGQGAINLAQGPNSDREVEHRSDPRIVTKAEGQVVVAARPEERERLFEMVLGFVVLSSEPMRDSRCAVSDTGLR